MTQTIDTLAESFIEGVNRSRIHSWPRMSVGLGVTVFLILAIGSSPVYCAEVRLVNPQINSKPVDRCLKEGRNRCSNTAQERVADETCRNRGHIRAVNDTVTHRGGFARAVSMFDSSRNRFVAGTGVDTIHRVLCTTADPVVRLLSPRNNTTILLEDQIMKRSKSTGVESVVEELILTWTLPRNLTTTALVGCLQPQRQFRNNRYECAGTSWSDNARSRRHDISYSDLRTHMGRTVYWSVRACQVSPRGNLQAGGQRLFCSNWATPRAVRIAAAKRPPTAATPTVTFMNDILPVMRSERCVRCHEANPGRSLPSWHTAASNRWPPLVNCTVCHSLQATGVSGWRGPTDAQQTQINFRNRTARQLCEMAKTGTGSHPTWQHHLRADPLVVWAVDNPRVPNVNNSPPSGRSVNSAFPGFVADWRALIGGWNTAGAACP